jgi:primosomal protein N'
MGAGGFGTSTEPTKVQPDPTKASQPLQTGSPSTSKLSPFAASFVPKFGLTGSLPTFTPAPAKPAPVESVAASGEETGDDDEDEAAIAAEEEEARAAEEEAARAAEEEAAKRLVAQQEAAKAAREAKLRDKLEAARKEEEARKKKAEEERARRQAEEEQRRTEEEQRRFEAEQQRLAEERARLETERLGRLKVEALHDATAQLLFADILEILVVPEVQYSIQNETRNRLVLAKAFEHWKFRVAKRIKRRRVLENMGLGRVGVAGAAEEVGELFDEDEVEGDDSSFVRERRRTSFREERNDAQLAAAMAQVRCLFAGIFTA